VRWTRLLPVVAAVAVLIAGAVVYEMVIPIHHVEQARLSRLVVSTPPAGFGATPTGSAVVPTSSNPFSSFKTMAQRAPHQTGAYDVEWRGTGSSSSNLASVLVAWLPTRADAAAVEKQAVSIDLAAATFKKSFNYLPKHQFAVAGVPGAQAALFGPSKGNQGVAVAVVPDGRFVAVSFVDLTSAAKAQTEVSSLAQAEEAHLQKVGQGFTLSVTHWPLEASLIVAGITVSLAALMVLVPLGIIRARRRRRVAREAAGRRAVQGRGHKIAKHQAARSR
jgi:hypothetical protein